jgi:hypothetical protein
VITQVKYLLDLSCVVPTKLEKATQLVVGFPQFSTAVHISVTSVRHCFPLCEIDCSDALSIETIV